MNKNVRRLNPQGLKTNPAFTPAIMVEGNVKTVYIGGQNAVNAGGEIVGKGDVASQTVQVFRNLEIALASAGAGLENVVKWNVYVVHGRPLQPAFEVFQKIWADRGNPPTLTMIQVAALAHPDFLVEIDAVAVISEE